jgi:hypothetical protein
MQSLILSIALGLMTSVAIGQATYPAQSSTENPNQHNVQTMRGCLSKAGHTYALLGGNPVRQYRITGGDTAALKGKEGHTVEITGPVGEVTSGASTNGKYNAGTTTGVGYDTIKAESVKDVADTCS